MSGEVGDTEGDLLGGTLLGGLLLDGVVLELVQLLDVLVELDGRLGGGLLRGGGGASGCHLGNSFHVVPGSTQDESPSVMR